MVWLAIPVLILDLTASDGGLVEGGMTGQWAWGDPSVGPVGLGECWATNLDADYLHDTVDTLEVPLPDLSGVTRPVVVVRHWYDIAAGDAGVVEVDPGTGFTVLDPVLGYPDVSGFTGASGGYVEHAFDLSGLGTTPRFRLSFTADPAVAAPGWALQEVVLWDGDVVPPVVTPLTVPTDTQDLDGPYVVEVQVTDDVGLSSVDLVWSTGGPDTVSAMAPLGGGVFRGQIPGQAPDTVVQWHVEADDGEQIGASDPDAFRVFLAAPTDLAGPTGSRLVADHAVLTWTAPVSPHPVLEYEVHQEGSDAVLLAPAESATVPLLADASQIFEVRAVYDVGTGDSSEPLELDVEVPELVSVEPATAYQGEELYVQLSGRSLYLLQGATTVDLGPDVRVLEVDVRDANAVTARVAIEPDADIGALDVAIDATAGRFSFADRFEIRAESEAPRIVRIDPPSLKQGDELEIEVQASTAFAGPVTVDGGEDLFLIGPVETAGDTATIPLAANTRARVGKHTLVLDDGQRLWAVDLQVDEYVAQLDRGCSTAPGAAWGASWILLLLGLRRQGSCPADPTDH